MKKVAIVNKNDKSTDWKILVTWQLKAEIKLTHKRNNDSNWQLTFKLMIVISNRIAMKLNDKKYGIYTQLTNKMMIRVSR